MGWYREWRPYVPVAERQRKAQRELARMKKGGHRPAPVIIEGRAITTTFWGNAWCEHLESFSDFENRLPRGRTYVRNGSVIDLQIAPKTVTARVMGSELYHVKIDIKPLKRQKWNTVMAACSGKIASLVELLQGRLSNAVMEIITDREQGLFPLPDEISLDCSCPDWADMCKHVAAVLYGVGARLDHQPELIFRLRDVDHLQLIAQAETAEGIGKAAASGPGRKLAAESLSDVFGIEIDAAPAPAAGAHTPGKRRAVAKAPKAPVTAAPAAALKTPKMAPAAKRGGTAKTEKTRGRAAPRRGKSAPAAEDQPHPRRRTNRRQPRG